MKLLQKYRTNLSWLISNFLGAFGMAIHSIIKWNKVDAAVWTFPVFFILGSIFSLHAFILLRWSNIKQRELQLSFQLRLTFQPIVATLLTYLSFVPFLIAYSSGSEYFKLSFRDFFDETFPIYALAAVFTLCFVEVMISGLNRVSTSNKSTL